MGERSRGCPRNRLQIEVLKDIRVLGVRNWTRVVITVRPGLIWWRSRKPIDTWRTKEECQQTRSWHSIARIVTRLQVGQPRNYGSIPGCNKRSFSSPKCPGQF